MKLRTLLFCVFFGLCPALSFAGSGKAIMPSWTAGSGNGKTSSMFFSNITENTIEVHITIYGLDGTVIPPTRYGGLINNNTQLPPKSSGFIEIFSAAAFNQGYLVIEWNNLEGDDDTVAMVAHGYNIGSNNLSSIRSDYSVPVNQGMPF